MLRACGRDGASCFRLLCDVGHLKDDPSESIR
jgi:hypothetical protein